MGPSRDGSSDAYAICALHVACGPGSGNRYAEAAIGREGGCAVPLLTPQQCEIAEARWMCVKEVLAMPFYAEGVFGEAMHVALEVAEGRRAGMGARSVPLAFRPGEAMLSFAEEL